MLLVLVAGSVAACANDVTAPTTVPSPDNSLTAVTTDSVGPWGFGRRGFGLMDGLIHARRLPASLQLSDAQRTQIRSLISAYRASHKDDLAALASVAKQAHAAARTSGLRMTGEQRRALFARTAPARQRLVTANMALHAQIQQLLTADQRTWLASHRPTLRPTNGPSRRRSIRRSHASGSATSTNY
jgi:Spy/CpxP family protein refolding chaperone